MKIQTNKNRISGATGVSKWAHKRWGDVGTLEYGRSLRGSETNGGQFPVYGTNGPIGFHAKPLCPHPGVIVGRKGAYRGIHYSPTPFFVIDTAFYLEPKTKLDLKWAYYKLLTYDINGMDSGSAIPSTSRDAFYSLPVDVPPYEEQLRIAAVLTAMDDKIELNRRMNETLEAISRAIFKSWFVDPIQGGIPKGWHASKIGEVVDFEYGEPLKEENRIEGPFPVYGSNGIVGWHNKSLAKGPGIVIGRKGNPGVVTWAAKDFWPIDTTFYVVPKKINMSMYYLYQTLFSCDLPSLGADSAVPGLNRNMAYMTDLSIPPDAALLQFDKLLAPIYKTIDTNNDESKTLATTRDALLPKLMSGEVDL